MWRFCECQCGGWCEKKSLWSLLHLSEICVRLVQFKVSRMNDNKILCWTGGKFIQSPTLSALCLKKGNTVFWSLFVKCRMDYKVNSNTTLWLVFKGKQTSSPEETVIRADLSVSFSSAYSTLCELVVESIHMNNLYACTGIWIGILLQPSSNRLTGERNINHKSIFYNMSSKGKPTALLETRIHQVDHIFENIHKKCDL